MIAEKALIFQGFFCCIIFINFEIFNDSMILYPKKNRQCIFVKGKQLQIGEILNFTITKILAIDEDKFYVLTDDTGVHYLIPTEYYTDYNFTIGMKIKGWVDKINCTGRVFIEPAHPFYNVGQIYDFEFLNYSLPASQDGIMKSIFTVRDQMGKIWKTESIQILKNLPETVKCKIKKIKKGELFLQIV